MYRARDFQAAWSRKLTLEPDVVVASKRQVKPHDSVLIMSHDSRLTSNFNVGCLSVVDSGVSVWHLANNSALKMKGNGLYWRGWFDSSIIYSFPDKFCRN